MEEKLNDYQIDTSLTPKERIDKLLKEAKELKEAKAKINSEIVPEGTQDVESLDSYSVVGDSSSYDELNDSSDTWSLVSNNNDNSNSVNFIGEDSDIEII